jgi:hypothetical protein
MRQLTLEEMKALPTKRLLAYKRKLYDHHPSAAEDWVSYCTCHECMQIKEHFKSFDNYLNQLREILATREHVSTPGKLAVSAARRAWHADVKACRAAWAKRYSRQPR